MSGIDATEYYVEEEEVTPLPFNAADSDVSKCQSRSWPINVQSDIKTVWLYTCMLGVTKQCAHHHLLCQYICMHSLHSVCSSQFPIALFHTRALIYQF